MIEKTKEYERNCKIMKKFSGNPALTSLYTADPSAHVWEDGRIYIYASHDQDPPRGCDLMDCYHVFSSSDMANWRDEGEILCSDDVEWGRPEGGFMWAPDAAYKNGKYYFYYPHPSGSDWNNTWKIAVAVSDHPAKGFKDLGPIAGLGGFALIDPCVFVDNDGRAYMYYGGGGKCLGGEMNDDMISMKTEPVPMVGVEDFHEAAWVFRRGDMYYLTYSDNLPGKNRLCYSTSDSPLGPWTYRGVYLDSTDCDTSHGSVVEYKGQWYQFYHNCSISHRGNLRSVCIDKIEFDENGLMKVIEQTADGIAALTDTPEPALPAEVIFEEKRAIEDGAETEFKVCGKDGGRVQLRIFCEETDHVRVRVFVNGKDCQLMNLIGGEGYQTFMLNPGKNEIKLAAHQNGVTITKVQAEYLD